MKRNIYSEIESINQRSNFQHGWKLISELKEVHTTFQALYDAETTREVTIYQYIPVTIIACFESYFRIKVQELIAIGEPYVSNCKQLNDIKNLKFDLFDFMGLKSGEIKSGDMVAHTLSFNNVESVNTIFSQLLNKNFFKEVKDFTPAKPIEHFHQKARFFKQNEDFIFRDVAYTYELRHIYCHEFNAWIEVEVPTIFRYLKHSIAFLEKMEIYFNHIIYPDLPTELNDKQKAAIAKREFLETQQKLDNLIAKIFHEMDSLGYDTDLLQEQVNGDIILWKKYRTKLSSQYCTIYEGWNNYSSVYWNHMKEMTQEKTTSLYESYQFYFKVLNKFNKVPKFS